MKICVISDTHCKHRSLEMPDADILLCAGDITMKGELAAIGDFSNWLAGLNYKNKLISFGNHELGHDRPCKKKDDGIKMIQDSGAIYLEHQDIVIDGIKIWMSPASPWFFNWAWNYQRGNDIAAVWAKIPNDVNVIVTHGPIYKIMDEAPRDFGDYENVGCKDLLNRVSELKQLKLFCCGHIHNSYSAEPLEINGVKYVNASICNEKYQAVNKPVVIEI